MLLTSNQVNEDEKFYKKINCLPKSLEGLYLDKYDQPLIKIREKIDASYFLDD